MLHSNWVRTLLGPPRPRPHVAPAAIWQRLVQAAGPGGRLRFDRFMEVALYDPEHGYFTKSAARAGRGGDFLTSVEVAPLFGACLERFLENAWRKDSAGDFHVLELGAGRGTLARDLTGAAPPEFRKTLRLHLVEASPAARALHEGLGVPRLRSYARLDDVPSRLENGAVVANEFFDNLPVRRVAKSSGWKEIVVGVRGSRLREELVEAAPDLMELIERHGVRLREGQAAEVSPPLESMARAALDRVRRGAFCFIDYGDEAERLYGDAWPQGTLAAHRAHATSRDLYEAVGDQDLTAHVNFTVLRRTAESLGYTTRLVSQSQFLADHGIGELVAERVAQERDELAKLRLTQWARILFHPEAMGEKFRVLYGFRSGPGPESSSLGAPNR